jgi:hypothetical protein
MRPISKAALLILVWTGQSLIAEEPLTLVDRPARNSSRDTKIPQSLVKKLESDYHAFLVKNEVSQKENIKRKLLNISAELTQKKPSALHENARIVTPLGGGVVDLSEFVTPVRGAFSMKILAHKEDGSDPGNLRVFYVSKAKTRVIDGDEYGAGCGKYMEITSYYNKRNSRRGFDLYTAAQRYLSVVGGTFVIVDFEKDALHVGSLTFMDSRYPDLLCE